MMTTIRHLACLTCLCLAAVAGLLGCGRGAVPPPTSTPTPTASPTLPPPPVTPLPPLAFTADGDLHQLDRDGTERALTAHPAPVGMPAWSPDGTWVAFRVDHEGQSDLMLAPAAAPGDRAQQVALTHDAEPDHTPAWSPDNWHLAFGRYKGNTWGIFVLGVVSDPPTAIDRLRVTQNFFYEGHPAWSPDGTRIAYTSDDAGDRWRVMVVDYERWLGDPAGTTPVPYPGLDSLAHTAYPSWSPDGTRLAFAATVDGNWEIYVTPDTGAAPLRLTDHPARDWDAAWSPDGHWIAFVSDRSGDPDLYAVRPDGTEIVRLTARDAVELDPAWLPQDE